MKECAIAILGSSIYYFADLCLYIIYLHSELSWCECCSSPLGADSCGDTWRGVVGTLRPVPASKQCYYLFTLIRVHNILLSSPWQKSRVCSEIVSVDPVVLGWFDSVKVNRPLVGTWGELTASPKPSERLGTYKVGVDGTIPAKNIIFAVRRD